MKTKTNTSKNKEDKNSVKMRKEVFETISFSLKTLPMTHLVTFICKRGPSKIG